MTETGKVAIAVALIGALSAIGAKLVEMQGKESPTASPTAVSIPPPSSATKPAAATPAAEAAAASPVAPDATMAGTWTDKDGDALTIEQSGTAFTVTRWSFAGFLGASGTLAAGRVAFDYHTRDTPLGSCAGTLSASGKEAVLACDEPGNSYRQVLRRVG